MDRDEEKHTLHFYNSRSDRLESASQAVRDLNEDGGGKRPSLMQTLVPNRGSAFLLLAIIMLAATMFVTRLLDRNPGKSLAGHSLQAHAIGIDGMIHLVVTRTNPERIAPPGIVILSIQGQPEGPTLVRELVFSHLESEQYRVSFEGESESLLLLFSVNEEYVLLRTPVTRARD